MSVIISFLSLDRRTKLCLFLGLVSVILLIYFKVSVSYGMKYVYSHFMYLPVIIASLCFGKAAGIIIALEGIILWAPFMPVDTGGIFSTRELYANWTLRAFIFLFNSAIFGLYGDFVRKSFVRIKDIVAYNPETGILNLQGLHINHQVREFFGSHGKILFFSISWINCDSIFNMFGRNVGLSIIKKINKRIEKHMPDDRHILFQEGVSKLFLCVNAETCGISAEQIASFLDKPFTIDGIPFYAEFSVGMYLYDRFAEKPDMPLDPDLKFFRKADMASIYAKDLGISSSVFDEKSIVVSRSNLLLLGEFPEALEQKQTVLYYQPQLDLNTHEPVGVEALVRWMHPEKGMISPAEFIPLVEKSQLIHPLTEFVVKQSLAKQMEFNLNSLNPVIAVNISPRNMQNSFFIEKVIEFFNTYELQPQQIEFEVTEASLLDNSEKIIKAFNLFKEHRIMLCIDDFGTGYSSLSYLNRLPIDKIKIDQYFIRNLLKDNGVKHIVKSIIDMSHSLGCRVVAEGIEDADTENELLILGCDIGQGYLYSKPVSDSGIIPWFREHERGHLKTSGLYSEIRSAASLAGNLK
jgi:EAL domain-containing protein (putative c-di-GMP-specific phosphodiesterase class I)